MCGKNRELHMRGTVLPEAVVLVVAGTQQSAYPQECADRVLNADPSLRTRSVPVPAGEHSNLNGRARQSRRRALERRSERRELARRNQAGVASFARRPKPLRLSS